MSREGRTRSLRFASALCSPVLRVLQCASHPYGPARADPLIAAAGDIACDTSSEFLTTGPEPRTTVGRETRPICSSASPTAVLTLGDNQYHVGSLSDFNASFDPTWGRLKPIIHRLGNHEYGTAGARATSTTSTARGTSGRPASAIRAITASTSAAGT